MAILIDAPLWPAHGALWSHLVSDHSYDELHEFATQMPLPRRGFDLDHYDVPQSLHARAIDLGALAVDSRTLVHRLKDSGLRVVGRDRSAARPLRRRQYLTTEWHRLGSHAGVASSERTRTDWLRLGDEVLTRWNEPHRRYHDESHLEDVLLSLDQISIRGERLAPESLLAAWFHDVIYTGAGGADEHHSAQYAIEALSRFDFSRKLVEGVGELIVATTPNFVTSAMPAALAHLLDADLSIFGASEQRYQRYSDAVRQEYAHVPEAQFREGRASILNAYLDNDQIYRSVAGRELWEQRARSNLAREIAALSGPKRSR